MQTRIHRKNGKRAHRATVAGFTLVEALIASGVMFLFVTVCMTALLFDEVAVFKSKDEALVMNFMNHYTENLKALPFSSIASGYPINSLYNGQNGAPNILIPTTGSTISLTNTDYQTFDPDLLWLSGSAPVMGFIMDQNYSNGVLHDVHFDITVTWTAPLQKGGSMQMETDLVRTQDQ